MNKSLNYQGDFAVEIAKAASAAMRKDFFQRDCKVTKKADGTDLTRTDTRINDMVIRAVRAEFPEHNVFSEEMSDMGRKSECMWVCDPLDGTTAFIKGIPTFSFALSLVRDGTPVIGVIADSSGRLYKGGLGRQTTYDDEPVHVSQYPKLEGSSVGVSSFPREQVSLIKMPEKLRKEGAGFYELGSIATTGALVARGELTASVHPADKPWESAALNVIVLGAGGRVTDLYGNQQRYDGKIRGAVISNGHIHNELLRLVKSCE